MFRFTDKYLIWINLQKSIWKSIKDSYVIKVQKYNFILIVYLKRFLVAVVFNMSPKIYTYIFYSL